MVNLKGCPYVHADPLLVHQAAQACSSCNPVFAGGGPGGGSAKKPVRGGLGYPAGERSGINSGRHEPFFFLLHATLRPML